MVHLPEEFRDEFDMKEETFFQIAKSFYTYPDRQYTLEELADLTDRSKTTISNHVREMEAGEWLNRQEDQTTFAWNSVTHNPASTEGTDAVRRFYVDLWSLLKKHAGTAPGTFAIMGFGMIIAAIVCFGFYVGFSVGVTQESNIPPAIYFVIGLGSFLSGVIVTFLSPVQALVNRIMWRFFPKNPF